MLINRPKNGSFQQFQIDIVLKQTVKEYAFIVLFSTEITHFSINYSFKIQIFRFKLIPIIF